ncbi:putative cyclin-like protein [Erysiphe neolycopersici]|uniref:Putative cyclin-like protein n=1 Tax=Erysiphe neolycopersici TaxID=212602 RepID=A0A420HU03_9PEZI|nr:putative cyclin-like protein [Erysiphe neolycopersici]
MHQSVYRPAFFEHFLHSTHTHDNTLNWKGPSAATSVTNFNLPQCSRDGLQTPPADGMSAAIPNHYYDLCCKGSNHSMAINLPPLDSSKNNRDEMLQVQLEPGRSRLKPNTENQRSISEHQSRRKSAMSNSNQIKLQIPSKFSLDGGSLSDFAAQITCLFWFESIETLNEAEGLLPASGVRIMRPESIPSSAFKKWISTVLTTTLLTENVIILALLFIYRLKKYNPSVKGRSGSEYRLFTVALMLGNKFLDDNTYTNNTWADVSGISVQEIHVMEVEFLSNMRYSLMVSKEQWEEWHQKLGLFATHCDAATRASVAPYSLPPMPSPPESTRASPPSNSKYSSLDTTRRQWPVLGSLSTTTSLSPSYYARKRSLDTEAGEPAVKKVITPNSRRNNNNAPHRLTNIIQNDTSHLPPISTNQSRVAESGKLVHPGSTNLVLPPLGSLPPSNSRPTPDFFTTNQASQFWTQQYSFPMSLQQSTSPQSHSSIQELFSYNSSPVSANPGIHSGHISPSIFLRQRSSPYKPVRHVNTLLYTPPYGSIHENSVNVQEMRYRTIGRGNESLRTGVVPNWSTNLQPHHQ